MFGPASFDMLGGWKGRRRPPRVKYKQRLAAINAVLIRSGIMCSLTFTLPRVLREGVASNCDQSLRFHSRAHKSGDGDKKKKRKKKKRGKKNSHASPRTGHWSSAMLRLSVSKIRRANNFRGPCFMLMWQLVLYISAETVPLWCLISL